MTTPSGRPSDRTEAIMNDVLPNWISAKDGKIVLHIHTQPRASRSQIEGPYGTPERLKIRIAAPPVDGEANEELVRFLSKQLGVSKSHLEIKSGHTGKLKTIEIAAAPPEISAAVIFQKIKSNFKKS